MKVKKSILIILMITLIISVIPANVVASYKSDTDYHYFSTFRYGVPLGSQLRTILGITYGNYYNDPPFANYNQVYERCFLCIADDAYVTFNGDMGISINYLKRYDNSSLARTLYEIDFSKFDVIINYNPFEDTFKFKRNTSVVYLEFESGDIFEFKGKVVYWLPADLYTTSIYNEYVEVVFNY